MPSSDPHSPLLLSAARAGGASLAGVIRGIAGGAALRQAAAPAGRRPPWPAGSTRAVPGVRVGHGSTRRARTTCCCAGPGPSACPTPAPDIHGLAVRVAFPDGGHGDLLFATTGWSRPTRLLLLPGVSAERPMTTLLPYSTTAGALVLGARPDGDLTRLYAATPFGPVARVRRAARGRRTVRGRADQVRPGAEHAARAPVPALGEPAARAGVPDRPPHPAASRSWSATTPHVTGKIRAETNAPSSIDELAHRAVRLAPLVGGRAGVEGPLAVVHLVPGDVRVAEDDELGRREQPLAAGPRGRSSVRCRGSSRRRSPSSSSSSVSGAPQAATSGPSLLPRTAWTGANCCQLLERLGRHTSPACRIRSAPSSASRDCQAGTASSAAASGCRRGRRCARAQSAGCGCPPLWRIPCTRCVRSTTKARSRGGA